MLKLEAKVSSRELVEVINEIRYVEGNRSELRHYHLMDKIKKEMEVLEKAGIKADTKFSLGHYLDRNGQKRPQYKLSRDAALQILNSESAVVRYKTIEYINELERALQDGSYTIEDRAKRAKIWSMEEEYRQEILTEAQIMLPKAKYTDELLMAEETFTTTIMAKSFGLRSAQELNKILEEEEVQYKQRGQWLLYADYTGLGYTQEASYPYRDSDGIAKVNKQTEWTERGKNFVYNLLKERGRL